MTTPTARVKELAENPERIVVVDNFYLFPSNLVLRKSLLVPVLTLEIQRGRPPAILLAFIGALHDTRLHMPLGGEKEDCHAQRGEGAHSWQASGRRRQTEPENRGRASKGNQTGEAGLQGDGCKAEPARSLSLPR